MIKKHLTSINLCDIDDDDDIYRISTEQKNVKLYESLKTIGLVNPLVVQEKQTGYRMVCGFQRFSILRELQAKKTEAFVLPNAQPSVDVFWYAVMDNLAIRQLNAIQVSRIISTLETSFFVSQEKIIQHYLPALGFGRNPRVYTLYKDLYELNETWQKWVIYDQTPIDVANDIRLLSKTEQEVLFNVYSALRLGKNRQREFLLLLKDVCRIHEITFLQLFEQQKVKALLDETKITSSQKADSFKVWLWEQRYPHYMKTKQKYETLLRENVPPRVDIQAPPFFEGEEFRVTFSFASKQEYIQRLEHLQALVSNKTIHQMLSLL